MTSSFGKFVYALANIALGVFIFFWRDTAALNNTHFHHVISLIAAAVEILAGIALLLPRLVRCGAIALILVYIATGLTAVPLVLKQPGVYANWGEFFYQLALAVGAIILYAQSANKPSIARIGVIAFALCNVSFALEQYEFFVPTAQFVPHWVPLSGAFWVWATNVFFVLTAIALLTGILARLAAQLSTAMFILFALLALLPVVIANPHSFFRATELVETCLTAASAWVLADYLSSREPRARTYVTS